MTILEQTLNWTFPICANQENQQIMHMNKIWKHLTIFSQISSNLIERFFQMTYVGYEPAFAEHGGPPPL